MSKEFISLVAEAIEIDPSTITLEDEFRNYEVWDSLGYLSLIAAIDEHYGLVIDTSTFQEFNTLEDIYQYCENHKL